MSERLKPREVIRDAYKVLRALDHNFRQLIINRLREVESSTVTQLFIHFRVDQSVMSQQLAVLRKARIVKVSRDSKYAFYSLNEDRITEILDLALELKMGKLANHATGFQDPETAKQRGVCNAVQY